MTAHYADDGTQGWAGARFTDAISGHGCTDVEPDRRPLEERVDLPALRAWNRANKRARTAYYASQEPAE